MSKRILICGLPGSGKTTFAKELLSNLETEDRRATWYNADQVRKQFNDWDFTPEGRLRQAQRMRDLADAANTYYVIADFVAPTRETRDIFGADYTVWMDTVYESKFQDTNQMFEAVTEANSKVNQKNEKYRVREIAKDIRRWT